MPSASLPGAVHWVEGLCGGGPSVCVCGGVCVCEGAVVVVARPAPRRRWSWPHETLLTMTRACVAPAAHRRLCVCTCVRVH